jgi:hypothetical protein
LVQILVQKRCSFLLSGATEKKEVLLSDTE